MLWVVAGVNAVLGLINVYMMMVWGFSWANVAAVALAAFASGWCLAFAVVMMK